MKNLKVLFCQVLLFGFTLSSPIENKSKDNKSISTATDATPLKASTPKNINKEEVQNMNNSKSENPVTKKREIPEEFNENIDFFNDETNGSDMEDINQMNSYDKIQLLRSRWNSRYLEPSPRVSDVGYLGEARRKRNPYDNGIVAKLDGYYMPDFKLTAEDLMTYQAIKDEERALSDNSPDGQWNPIEESEVVIEDDPNTVGGFYDQRFQNWEALPKTEQLMANRRRPSSELRVPLYKRAIL